jgi:DNA-directed RNA polymerase specialized sigma24 family protein
VRDQFISEAYAELRDRARHMSRGAPPSLVGTSGLHAVLEQVIRTRKEFQSREHFVGYCLIALRRTWISGWRSRNRRDVREAAATLGFVAMSGGDSAVPAPDECAAAAELLRQLRADTFLPDRKQIARVVERCVLAAFSQDEAAQDLCIGKTTVQRRLEQFRAWAQLTIAPERETIERHIEALVHDETVARSGRIAETARRHYLRGEPRVVVAAALRTPPAAVDRDLRFFRAWAAARDVREAERRVRSA